MNSYLAVYNDLANQAWRRMVDLVGVHTVNILIERAAWLSREKYNEASLIEYSEAGISFSRMDPIEPSQAKAVVEEFFISLIDILTRLVGKEITRKLAEEIDSIIEGGEG